MPLKYLFVAHFADGSVIEQMQEDKSEIEPEKRSRFFDVLERSKTTKLTYFALTPAEGVGGSTYAVDLADGHFEVNGVPFFMHDSDAKDFRIVFWREHKHHAVLGASGIKSEWEEISAYKIGWQSDQDGKEHERVMRVE